MITLVEALHYRCLKYVHQPLESFHVLVGPNASGKTTFLDVIGFLSQLLSEGLNSAIEERTSNFYDLTWKRKEPGFELAIEAEIPKDRKARLKDAQEYDTIRFEIALGMSLDAQEVHIKRETVLLTKHDSASHSEQRELFPQTIVPPTTLCGRHKKYRRMIVNKVAGGNDNYYSETYDRKKGKGWAPNLGPRKSAFANLFEDEENFPVSTWFRSLLIKGVKHIILNSLLIRKASPPAKGISFKPDGSNIPWMIEILRKNDPKRFIGWIEHLRTALPDIEDIKTVEREDDRHRYLVIRYSNGVDVPSWMVSDGTLRLLALTLPAYLQPFTGIYLIEEPENGIHPSAVESVFQSLSSVYDAQILLATHSPVILGSANLHQILCFAKTKEGATDIVTGTEHPQLRDWKGEVDLGVLFASGVLG